ncbi:MAG: histidine kinase dimerization/phospho-acceptor domain-containing protein [Moraxella osloensis]
MADAAHELRSPLTAISLQVQQLQKYSQDAAMYSDPAGKPNSNKTFISSLSE